MSVTHSIIPDSSTTLRMTVRAEEFGNGLGAKTKSKKNSQKSEVKTVMKRVKGVKGLSKKLWITLVSVFLGAMIAVGGAIAGVTLSSNKRGLGGNLADSAADLVVDRTFQIDNTYRTYEAAWKAAITYSITSNRAVGFRLTQDWVASPSSKVINENTTETEVTSFGSSTDDENATVTGAFFHGAICVPRGAQVVLNMGTYKIDRNLMDNGTEQSKTNYEAALENSGVHYGGVIYVAGGTLQVNGTVTRYDDSRAKRGGKRNNGTVDLTPLEGYGYDVTGVEMSGALITGGFNKTGGTGFTSGGIQVSSVNPNTGLAADANSIRGKLDMNGVAVFNNEEWGATGSGGGNSGVYGSDFTAKNCYFVRGLTNSSSNDAAGLCTSGSSTLTIDGCTFSWNSTVREDFGCVGGGICLQDGIIGTVKNCEFHHNRGGQGGGIGIWGYERQNDPVTTYANVIGCNVHDNIASCLGGGIGCKESFTDLEDTTIENNKVYSPDSASDTVVQNNDRTAGGGLSFYGAYGGEGQYKGRVLAIKGKIVIKNNETTAGITTNMKAFTSSASTAEVSIDISGPLEEGTDIGIYMQNPGTFTRGFVTHHTNIPASNFFTSDVTGYDVTINANVEGALVPLTDPTLLWNSAVNSSLNHDGALANALIDTTAVSSWLSDSSGNFAPSDLISFGSGTEDGARGRSNIRLPKNARVTLDLGGITINRRLSGNAVEDGYVFLIEGNLSLSNGTIIGGYNTGNGGAFYVKSGGSLTLTNVNIAANHALNGSAIYLEEGASLTINGGEISGNTAAEYGAVYVNSNTQCTITGGLQLKDNTGINRHSNLFLAQNALLSNIVSFTSTTTIGVTLGTGSGDIVALAATELIENHHSTATCFIPDNDVDVDGVSLYASSAYLKDGHVTIGLVRTTNASVTLAEVWAATVEKALADTSVAHVFTLDRDWAAAASGFDGGQPFAHGFVNGSLNVPANAKIVLNLVGNHTLDRRGAGSVIIVNGTLTVKGSGIITGGSTTGNGGGIRVDNGGSLDLRGGEITGNHAEGFGGGVYGGSVLLEGAVITDNTAAVGGGVYASGVTLSGHTVIKNNHDNNNNSNNLFIDDGQTIAVTNAANSEIGISKNEVGAFTSGLNAGSAEAVMAVFSADDSDNVVSLVPDGTEGYIGKKVAEPVAKYTGWTYNGQAREVVDDVDGVTALLGNAYTLAVERTYTRGGSEVTEAVAGNPLSIGSQSVGAGEYTFTFTLNTGFLWESEDNRGSKTFSFTVTIEKATAEVTKAPEISGDIYVGQTLASLQERLGGGEVSFNGQDVPGSWALVPADGVLGEVTSLNYLFTPDDPSFNEITGAISVRVSNLNVTLTHYGADLEVLATQTISVDYGSDVTSEVTDVTVDDESVQRTTFTYTTNGATRTVVFTGPVGYTAMVGTALNADNEPDGGDSLINVTPRTTNTLVVGYIAKEVSYTVYHVRQSLNKSSNGEYTVSYPTEAQIQLGGSLVTKEERTALAGSFVNPQSYSKVNSDPALTGFRLDTLSDSSSSQATLTSVRIGGDGKTGVYVYYERQSYTLTFFASGANNPNRSQTKTFIYGEEVDLNLLGDADGVQLNRASNLGRDIKVIHTPAKTSNTFTGWYTDSNCSVGNDVFGTIVISDNGKTVSGSKTFTVTENRTFYAKFEADQYNIVFLLNDDNNPNSQPDSTSDGYDDIASSAFDSSYLQSLRENYSWNINALFTGSLADRLDYDNDNGADMLAGRYVLSYDANVLTSTKNLKGVVPAVLGYRFNNWMEYVNGRWVAVAGINRINTNTAKTRTLVASWTPVNYTIRFNTMGGSTKSNVSATNTAAWTTVLGSVTAPTKLGYEFAGWASTEEAARAGIDGGNYIIDASGATNSFGDNFLIYDFIGMDDSPYDRNATTITLYAMWESQEVTISVDDVNYSVEKYGEMSFETGDGTVGDGGIVKVDDVVTVSVAEKPGYILNRIIVNNTRMAPGNFTFTVQSHYGNEIKVSAEFTLESYSITYERNGGTSTDRNVARSYNVENADRITLPSYLVKDGFDFKGWNFEGTQLSAFSTESTKTNLYGETLNFTRIQINDELRSVTLEAVWEAQAAPVYLYNATYDSTVYTPHDSDGDGVNDSFEIEYDRFNNDALIGTGSDIKIINPVRRNFDFIGWATREGGAVVYPAGTAESVTINDETRYLTGYKVNADHDINDRPFNANRLYAVWHVSGVQRINMTVEGNNASYGGSVTMSASPETVYDNPQVTLTFTWYLVIEGRYEMCFTDKEFTETVDGETFGYYVDENGDTVGKYRIENGTKTFVEDSTFPGGGRQTDRVLTYKVFNPAAATTSATQTPTAAHGCRYIDSSSDPANASGENINLHSISLVNESGLYICYVTATGDQGTNDSAYGEIEAILQKVTYDGLELNSDNRAYNASAQGIAVTIPDSANGRVVGDVITLPDGSRVRVTYTYMRGNETVASADVKDVGTYRVVASFSWISNEGNYEDLTDREAELTITPRAINTVDLMMNHEGTASTNFGGINNYSVGYDGKAYSVSAEIKDTFSVDGRTVAEIDGIELELNVYKIAVMGAENVNNTAIDAGSYYVLVTGITGEKAGNYTLGNVISRKDFTVNKATRNDVIENIVFEDVETVFDNKLHTVELKWKDGYSKPDEVTFEYELTDYAPEDPNFTEEHYNYNEAEGRPAPTGNNGGYYAGVYTVTAKFEDSDSNYEPIADVTATLTIGKQDFFKFYDKEAMLTNAGFKSETYGYLTTANYVPYISGGQLVGSLASGVSLSYDYYRYASAESDVRTVFLSVTQEQAAAHAAIMNTTDAANHPDYIRGISESGRYAIVLNIEYVESEKFGMLFSNNLNLPTEEERTIYYEIAEGVVSGIKVDIGSFDKDNVALGSEFLVSDIEGITVYYGDDGDDEITLTGDRIANVQIDYGTKNAEIQNTFWHVGKFTVTFTFYGRTDTVEFTVKQNITDVTVQYSEDGGSSWSSVSANTRLDYDRDPSNPYQFRITYSRVNGAGDEERATTAVNYTTLNHGVNSLTAAAEDYYTFDGAEITVELFRTISDSDIRWEYSADGEHWAELPDTLPYIGSEYEVRAVYTGVDGRETSSEATVGNMGLVNFAEGGYTLTVLTQNGYIVNATRGIVISKVVAEFTWDKVRVPFNAQVQSPEATPTNIYEKDGVEILYSFTNESGAALQAAQVIRAGKYVATVVLSGNDSALLANYTTVGSTTVSHDFEITKADIQLEATYNEADYGEGKTYEHNPTGLRTSALKAVFAEGATEVDGSFTFIRSYTETSDGVRTPVLYESESAIAEDLTLGIVNINYVYKPVNSLDYNPKYGTVRLEVQQQESRKGNNSLTIELGAGAYSYYLVNQTFSTTGIRVFREYNSFYVEGAGSNRRTYGLREELTNGINYSIDGKSGQAHGQKITAQDLAGGHITLLATYVDGSNGRRNFEVMTSNPTGLILPDNLEDTYYVGQYFDYSKIDEATGSETIQFTVTFENGQEVQMIKGDVKSDFDGYQFKESDAGKTMTVTFYAFGDSPDQTVAKQTKVITVQPQEDLVDVLVFEDEVTLVYEEGKTLNVPAMLYNVDGVTSDALDGVKCEAYIDGQKTDEIPGGVGDYVIRYMFEVTNPRFKSMEGKYVEITVHVTEEKYTYEFSEPEQKEYKYTGGVIAASNVDGTLVKVWDVTDKTETAISTSRIKVEYLVDGVVYKTITRGQEHLDTEKWNVINVIHEVNGVEKTEYEIEVRVYVDDFEKPISLKTTKFVIKVTQAENKATLTPSKNFVIVGNDSDLESIFSINADFYDKGTAYFQYMKDGDTSYTRGLPDITDANAGKYRIRYYIPATTNYAGVDNAIAEIEIRRQSLKDESNGNDIEIIDGAYGIGAGVRLQTSKVQTEDLEAISIRRQNVLDGYDVNLVSGDTVVQPNGNVTVRVKLGAEFADRTDLNVYLYGEDGRATRLEAEVDENGYLVFTTNTLGRIAITESIVGAPVGLIAGVSVGAVVAAALIVACVLVFLKKRGN